ncbi:hypothetical protein IWQ56_004646 [Coemansia nantahalensis]|uniref:Uncharacterized protein n=1 Tax=Coemansia helicoidea TaxID=1286919 RepID=A0ACC1KR83_9FUNG|nr:hypothetical protein IWQ56_004646 [Coemansia nantahalensis]KAJ2793596.1 hypothetical protein H4R21_005831 [Coemansia helicoidea]
MDLVSASSLTEHPPATFAGGQRRSQPTTGVLRPKKEESPEAEDEEGSTKDVLRQSQADNEFFMEQVKQDQAHRMAHTMRIPNAALNTAPKNVKQGYIRQPSQFPKGTPADFKAAAKELGS